MRNPSSQSEPVRCSRCRRPLRAASSVAAKIGRYCKARERAERAEREAEAVHDFTAAQVEKARELISDRGIVPTSRPGVYRTVSSDGSAIYLTHFAACTCPAGTRGLGRLCFHRAAVRLLAVNRKAA